MRVQDFMVGDYVCNQNDVPFTITEGMFVRFMNDEYTFALLWKPIELTDDIIRNNFDTDSNRAFIINSTVIFEYYFDIKTYAFSCGDMRFVGKIKYVHQLQQLFRIFCIDKELKL